MDEGKERLRTSFKVSESSGVKKFTCQICNLTFTMPSTQEGVPEGLLEHTKEHIEKGEWK